ncbi:MAG: alpha/beta fold hydrolase [Marmoricola sp.]
MSGAHAGRITSFTHQGLTFDVLDEGPLEGGVVVLLHGFPQTNTSWGKVAPLLHAEGFRTLAPNQRGYSPGARPHGRRSYITGKLAGDVLALIEQVGGPVHLVGHDWGAAVAWAVAIQRPAALRSLTAVSVPHPGAFLAAMPKGQALHSWYMGAFNIPALPERLMAGPFGDWFLRRAGMTPDMVATYHREIVDTGALPGGLGWYRALPLSDRKAMGTPARVPTTYVWSDGDVALTRTGAQLCEQYVDAPYELVVLQGVSHWIPDERPEELARAVLDRIAAVS